jgi:hypothetical protein
MNKNDKSTLEQAADKVNDAVEEIALKGADAAIEPDLKQLAGTSNEQVYLPEASDGAIDPSARLIPTSDAEPRSPIKKVRKRVKVDR